MEQRTRRSGGPRAKPPVDLRPPGAREESEHRRERGVRQDAGVGARVRVRRLRAVTRKVWKRGRWVKEKGTGERAVEAWDSASRKPGTRRDRAIVAVTVRVREVAVSAAAGEGLACLGGRAG